MDHIPDIVHRQHRFFRSGTTKDISFRIDRLKQLKQCLKTNEEDLLEATYCDFKKPYFETYGTEVGILYDEIDHILKQLPKWAKPKKVTCSLINFPSRNYIHFQPYGVSLVIGAWNYPLQLALNPALGSMAAGNCTLIKPSELAPHSSSLLAEIINSSFDPEYLHVVIGDAETTQKLLSQPLDYIFFTGSTRVGRIIMKEAAEQLTPVTLELGGKSPAIVDCTASLNTAARRIAWGKFVNAGQTCVAPDYLYVHTSIKKQLVAFLQEEITNFYGSDIQRSPDYARIINDNHFHRLLNYLQNGRVLYGGNHQSDSRFIEPTLMENVDWNDPIMQEEIFGPILPILEFETVDEVIETLSSKPSPLALYLFSNAKNIQKRVIEELKFGGGCINDTIAHLGNHNLPFGGVGQSGFGSYHGKNSFELFSHQKSILKKPNWPKLSLRYPPYSDNLKWLRKIFN